MLALPTIWALVALAPMVAMVELAAGIRLRVVAIILDPATESLMLATLQLDLAIIAVVRVIFDQAPALRVADMVLLCVAIDLLFGASIHQVAAMDPTFQLDLDLKIELPDDLLVDPTLPNLDSHTARLALAVSLPVIVLALIILELATLKMDPLVA